MKPVPILAVLALLAGCASSPPRYSLDVKATRMTDDSILVEGKILDRAAGGDTQTILPKVLMKPGTEADVYVGADPGGVWTQDGVHGTAKTIDGQVLYTASIIEGGEETWRGEARVPIVMDKNDRLRSN